MRGFVKVGLINGEPCPLLASASSPVTWVRRRAADSVSCPPPRGREQSVDLTPVVAPCPQKALLTHVMGLPASTSRREFETAVYERVDGDERSVDSLRW